jgi:flavodoxin
MKKRKMLFVLLTVISACLVFTVVHAQKTASAGETKITKSGEANKKPVPGKKKILIAYFSHSGNTREVANQIHGLVGGDIFEIQTVQPYPSNYDAVTKQAKQEQEAGFKPRLEGKVKDIESYDVIFVGYPNWWGTIPMAFVTFFSEYNFPGKTLVPFCTHEGSYLGRSIDDIKKLCPRSSILDGLAVRGSNVKNAQNEVSRWLRKIGII